MPATRIATTKNASGAPATTQFISVARAAGEGLLLEIAYGYQWAPPDAIVSVVWDPTGDNQALTLVEDQNSNGENRNLAVYAIPACTSAKTGDVVVTFAGSDNGLVFMCISRIAGHDVAGMIRDSAKVPGNIFHPQLSVDSEVGDLVIASMLMRQDSTVLSADAGQSDLMVEGVGYGISLLSSIKAGAATSTTVGYLDNGTSAGPYDSALIAVSIKPGGSDTLMGQACL